MRLYKHFYLRIWTYIDEKEDIDSLIPRIEAVYLSYCSGMTPRCIPFLDDLPKKSASDFSLMAYLLFWQVSSFLEAKPII